MRKTEFKRFWRFARSGEALKPVSIPHDAMLLEARKQGNPSGSGCAYFGDGCYHPLRPQSGSSAAPGRADHPAGER